MDGHRTQHLDQQETARRFFRAAPGDIQGDGHIADVSRHAAPNGQRETPAWWRRTRRGGRCRAGRKKVGPPNHSPRRRWAMCFGDDKLESDRAGFSARAPAGLDRAMASASANTFEEAEGHSYDGGAGRPVGESTAAGEVHEPSSKITFNCAGSRGIGRPGWRRAGGDHRRRWPTRPRFASLARRRAVPAILPVTPNGVIAHLNGPRRRIRG